MGEEVWKSLTELKSQNRTTSRFLK